MINVISLATYFPVLRPLQVVLKPLKRFYRRYGNKPYTKAVGGVVGERFEELVKKKRADKLYSIVPYLLVMVEMFESREAVEMMVDGIQSNGDLWAWIRYFNLPEDGWDGDGPPPLVGKLDHANEPDTRVGMAPAWLGFLVSDAEAATRSKRKRRGGKKLGLTITDIRKDFPGLDAKNFTKGIKELLKAYRIVHRRI